MPLPGELPSGGAASYAGILASLLRDGVPLPDAIRLVLGMMSADLKLVSGGTWVSDGDGVWFRG